MFINRFAPDWLQQLDAWAAGLQDSERLFLLLDTAFVPALHRDVAAALPPARVPRLLFDALPGGSTATQDVSPALLSYCVDEAHNDRLKTVLRRCDGWPMVHAIVTPESQQALGQRLARWCVVEADGQCFNFRFPDSRRLPGIYRHLTAAQRAQLVGPALQWRFIGRDGAWQRLPGLPLAPTTEPLETRLNAAQFAAMVDDSEADGILMLMKDRGVNPARPHAEQFAAVAQALTWAQERALDKATCVDWCEACLQDPALLQDQPAEQLERWLAVTLS